MPQPVDFVPAGPGVARHVTRLGGQPAWIDTPQWPLSRATGEPMRFIGQFQISPADGEAVALAYLFMTGDEPYVDGTWEPAGGENAVIVQPGGRVPAFTRVRPDSQGPSVGDEHLPVAAAERPAGEDAWQFLGGTGAEPVWLQGDENPGLGWRLIVQLDSAELPVWVNFGDAGVSYAFLSPDGGEGRFLWQCS